MAGNAKIFLIVIKCLPIKRYIFFEKACGKCTCNFFKNRGSNDDSRQKNKRD